MQDLQDVGLAPSEAERVLSWWKRYGGRKAVMLALAVALPLLRYEYLPWAMSSAVETLAEGYGLELTVREWDTLADRHQSDRPRCGDRDRRPVPREAALSRQRRGVRLESVTRVGERRAPGTGCWTADLPATVRDSRRDLPPHRPSPAPRCTSSDRSSGAWNTHDAFQVTTARRAAAASRTLPHSDHRRRRRVAHLGGAPAGRVRRRARGAALLVTRLLEGHDHAWLTCSCPWMIAAMPRA